MPLHMLFILTANKLKGKGRKNIKLRNKITLYLPIKHIKQLTGVPAVTGNPRHNKQHETGFWITCFIGHSHYQHVKIADSYEELSPLNNCYLDWRFRRSRNKCCCLNRWHRTTTRIIRFSWDLIWLSNKSTVEVNLAKESWASVSLTLTSWMLFSHQTQKAAGMPELQTYSSTVSTLGHLAELDTPFHNN